jgi:hypothetical protein
MDHNHFDHLVRRIAAPSLPSSSRGFEQGIIGRRSLLAAALATAVTRLGASGADARKRRGPKKRKQRAAPPNAYGCIDVGELCQTSAQCCSGICQGNNGQRTCRAHDASDCEAGAEPEGCGAIDVPCTTSSGQDGICGTTTGNAGYCLYTADCYACKTDVDCQRANDGFFGPTAACITCTDCVQTGGTACALAEFHPSMQRENDGERRRHR